MSADSSSVPGTTTAGDSPTSTAVSSSNSSNSITPAAVSSNTATAATTSAGAASITSTSTSTSQRSTGPRKNSAERSIVHTRMGDEQVQQEYSYGEILGEGSFGKVYRAQHLQTGETVAIKEIVKEKAGSSGLRQLEKEVSIFKKVDHKNIIKLKEVIESPKKMYLIMELCEGGDLAKLLQKRSHLTESDTKRVMSSLAEAIKYLHQQGVLHRDLKLENILLAEDPVEGGNILIKVSDFGLSTQQNNNSYENMQEQYCGTLSYMAPEMNSTYSYPVDVWAMGIIMYYLLTRYPKDNELNESISKDGPKFEEPQWEYVSVQAKDLLREMLTINPAYRPSSGEVLNHEWFTGKKREHGNVLELMRDFGREQKESGGSPGTAPNGEGDTACAINGLSISTPDGHRVDNSSSQQSDASSAAKKEPRKGSGGKKAGSSTDTLHTKTPHTSGIKSSKLKVSGTHPHTPSPRPASKTPTPKGGQEGTSKLSTTATRTTTTSTKPQAPNSNGPAVKSSPGNLSKVSSTPKNKRK